MRYPRPNALYLSKYCIYQEVQSRLIDPLAPVIYVTESRCYSIASSMKYYNNLTVPLCLPDITICSCYSQ